MNKHFWQSKHIEQCCRRRNEETVECCVNTREERHKSKRDQVLFVFLALNDGC